MDYDPFEIHMQLLALMRRLSASHQSIDNVVAFLVRYRDKCADDLWECVTDECQKGSLNVRINILYLLDSLLTTLQDLPPTVGAAAAAAAAVSTATVGSSFVSQLALAAESYPEWLARDLGKIIGWVVPREKEGLLNLLSAKQMLESWKTKRLLPAEVLAGALQTLEERRALAHTHTAEGTPSKTSGSSSSSSKRRKRNGADGFSTAETLRRMDEDRERHKRVRERLWVLPLPSPQSTAFTSSPSSAGRPPASRSLAALLPSSTISSTLALLPTGESPATAATTPQSPFTPSPASAGLPGNASSGGRAPRGIVDRGGLERAVDREFETGWDDELRPWDELDQAECERENALCFPERLPPASDQQVTV